MARRYDPNKHHRQSIRLRGYDYAQAGAYFVTICAQGRQCVFGDVVDGEMLLNDVGEIVAEAWQYTAVVRPNIVLDAFVVMPNHVHGIVVIAKPGRGVLQYAPTNADVRLRSPSQTIGAVVRGFKSTTTRHINTLRGTPGLPVWQRNYYDHIIRSDAALNHIRAYLATNPLRWNEDQLHPNNPSRW